MCRNITTLRGLQPVATPVEIEAAARQYVRKISGVQKTSPATEAAFEAAVAEIAHITAHLLADLPPRKQPPPRCRSFQSLLRSTANKRPKPKRYKRRQQCSTASSLCSG